MKHKYTWRRNHNMFNRSPGAEEAYKLLCETGWTNVKDLKERPVSVPHNVTCPKCLDLLIPKKQKELDQMLRNRQLTIAPTQPQEATL